MIVCLIVVFIFAVDVIGFIFVYYRDLFLIMLFGILIMLFETYV